MTLMESFNKNNAICIDASTITDQIKTRQNVIRNIALLPSQGNWRPSFTFRGISRLRIADIQVLTAVPGNDGKSRMSLLIVVGYDVNYTDGDGDRVQRDAACLEITLDKVCFDNSGVKRFHSGPGGKLLCSGKGVSSVKTQVCYETLGEMICPETGALIIDIGLFLVISCICTATLLVPGTIGDAAIRGEVEESQRYYQRR